MPSRDSNQYDPKDDKQTAADEALDRLLASADWPETPPLVLARLEKQWRDISPSYLARRRRRRLLVAAAAGLLLAAGIYTLWPAGGQRLDPRIAAEEDNLPPPDGPREDVEVDSSRAPNNLEEKSIAPVRKSRRPRPRTRRQWIAYRKGLDSAIHEAINQLAAKADWTGQQVVAAVEPFQRERDYCIRQLAQRVTNRKDVARHAAFDLMVELAGKHVDLGPWLTQLVAVPGCHDLAMRELVPRCDSVALATYTLHETNKTLQQDMLKQLLQRNDIRSVGAYLDLVADLKTRQPALQLLRTAETKPTTLFIGYLQRGDQVRSMAAVLALAELNDPRVVEQLGRLVLANVDRQAALMTLMVRSDRPSQSFLRQLAMAPAFTSDLVSARNRLANVIMVNTNVVHEL